MPKYAPFVMAVAAFLIIAGVIFGIYILATNTPSTLTGQTAANTSTGNPVLKPATVPSKIAVCQQGLTYASNGNPSPVQCNDGALNELAWNALSAQEPTVMTLGYYPTISQVEAAMCKDANAANLDSSAAISGPLEETAYQLASLYYGWSFNLNPASVIAGC